MRIFKVLLEVKLPRRWKKERKHQRIFQSLFFNEREISKENLRKSNEKEDFFQKHLASETIIKEKKKQITKINEINQNNLANYMKKNNKLYKFANKNNFEEVEIYNQPLKNRINLTNQEYNSKLSIEKKNLGNLENKSNINNKK